MSLIISGIIPQAQGGKMRGTVTIAGLDTSEHELAVLSQNIGIVLEDPETQLFTSKVINEVAFGAENLQIPPEEIFSRIRWALKVVRLEGYENQHPMMLSGGQKQRVAIASVLAMRPNILVLDEPTSQLDPIGTIEVFEVIKELKEKYSMTIVMVTHKSEEMAYFADNILVLSHGSVLAYGKPKDILSNREVTTNAWITIPQISELYLKLKERGIDLGEFPILQEEGVALIRDLLEKRLSANA